MCVHVYICVHINIIVCKYVCIYMCAWVYVLCCMLEAPSKTVERPVAACNPVELLYVGWHAWHCGNVVEEAAAMEDPERGDIWEQGISG